MMGHARHDMVAPDPLTFVQQSDVIFVTANCEYQHQTAPTLAHAVPHADRLGPLGFLSHPALNKGEGTSGAFGLLDQQLAMKWVQHNIAALGGCPDQVTAMGESAVSSTLFGRSRLDMFWTVSGRFQPLFPPHDALQCWSIPACDHAGQLHSLSPTHAVSTHTDAYRRAHSVTSSFRRHQKRRSKGVCWPQLPAASVPPLKTSSSAFETHTPKSSRQRCPGCVDCSSLRPGKIPQCGGFRWLTMP